MKKRHGEGCAAFVAAWTGYGVQCTGEGVRMQYTVIEIFSSRKPRRSGGETLNAFYNSCG